MRKSLSEREFEIVEAVIYYGSKKEAADALNISLYTVETTIKNVYERRGINKISDLTLWFCAVKFGIKKEISSFKKSVLPYIVIFLLLTDHANNQLKQHNGFICRSEIRQRRNRRRRKEYILHITTHNTNLSAA